MRDGTAAMLKVLFLTLAILALIGFIIAFKLIGWSLEKDTSAPLNRAQVAAEAEDMLGWMKTVEKGMQKRGMTEGYATILKHTPDYSYPAIHKSVLNIIARLERTIGMDKKSVQYQTAMNDIRGSIRELDLRVERFQFKHYTWWLILIAAPFWILGVVAGIMWYNE